MCTRCCHPIAALLSTENLSEILDQTWNYRARWRFIGIELGIDEGTLDAIEKDNRKVEDSLREMITLWLRGCNPKPSRYTISMALQSGRVSRTVGNDHLIVTFLYIYSMPLKVILFIYNMHSRIKFITQRLHDITKISLQSQDPSLHYRR